MQQRRTRRPQSSVSRKRKKRKAFLKKNLPIFLAVLAGIILLLVVIFLLAGEKNPDNESAQNQTPASTESLSERESERLRQDEIIGELEYELVSPTAEDMPGYTWDEAYVELLKKEAAENTGKEFYLFRPANASAPLLILSDARNEKIVSEVFLYSGNKLYRLLHLSDELEISTNAALLGNRTGTAVFRYESKTLHLYYTGDEIYEKAGMQAIPYHPLSLLQGEMTVENIGQYVNP